MDEKIFSDAEIRDAINEYLLSPPEKMKRKALLNIANYYHEENARLRRQVDILMGHDVYGSS